MQNLGIVFLHKFQSFWIYLEVLLMGPEAFNQYIFLKAQGARRANIKRPQIFGRYRRLIPKWCLMQIRKTIKLNYIKMRYTQSRIMCLLQTESELQEKNWAALQTVAGRTSPNFSLQYIQYTLLTAIHLYMIRPLMPSTCFYIMYTMIRRRSRSKFLNFS